MAEDFNFLTFFFETALMPALLLGLGGIITYVLSGRFQQNKIRYEIRNEISDLLATLNSKQIDLFNLINERNKADSNGYVYSKLGDQSNTDESKKRCRKFSEAVMDFDINNTSLKLNGKLMIYLKSKWKVFLYKKEDNTNSTINEDILQTAELDGNKNMNSNDGNEKERWYNVFYNKTVKEWLKYRIKIVKLSYEDIMEEINNITETIINYDRSSPETMATIRNMLDAEGIKLQSKNKQLDELLLIVHRTFFDINNNFQLWVQNRMGHIFSVLNYLKMRI